MLFKKHISALEFLEETHKCKRY